MGLLSPACPGTRQGMVDIRWDFTRNNPTIPELIIGGMVIEIDDTVITERKGPEYQNNSIGKHCIITINVIIRQLTAACEYSDGSKHADRVGPDVVWFEASSTSERMFKIRLIESTDREVTFPKTETEAVRVGYDEMLAELSDAYDRLLAFAAENDIDTDAQGFRTVGSNLETLAECIRATAESEE